MLLLSCNDLERGFDAGPLFSGVGFELHAGERVGLVGPNGVGKTTLMKILAGLDRPDAGEVRHHAGARVRPAAAATRFRSRTDALRRGQARALDELLAAHDDMIRTAEALATATDETDAQEPGGALRPPPRIAAATTTPFTSITRSRRCWTASAFASDDYHRPVDTFSGGQQSRLMLAKLLLSAPDVMLLDEPSNHLDIDTTRWLENYLVKQPEAMLIVSHDRYFLDRVVTKVFEMHKNRINVYPGNFKQYWRLREERYEQEMKAWESQKEYIDKQEEYIRRVHYGQLHKQAASRQKQLDKIERLERPTKIESPHMHFGECSPHAATWCCRSRTCARATTSRCSRT